MHTRDLDLHLSNLASRFAKSPVATDWPKALDYARRAADRALSQLAYETAADQYARAIDLLERQDSAGDLRTELLLAMGDAHNRAGQTAAAKVAFLEAADRARQAERPDLFAQAAIGFGGYVPIGVDIAEPEALALLEEALTLLGDEDSPARAIALSRLAQARYRSSAAAERSWQIDEALDIARRVGDPGTLGTVLLARHWTFYGPDDLAERVTCADEIVALGEEVGDPELVLHGMQCRVHDYLELGRVTDFRAAVEMRDRLAEDVRHPYYLWSVVVTRALEAAIAGRFTEADALIEQSLERRISVHRRQALAVQSAQLLQLRWLEGRMGELEPEYARRLRNDPESDDWKRLLAWINVSIGRHDDAARLLETVLERGLDHRPRDINWYIATMSVADVCSQLEHKEGSAQVYELLLPYRDRNCIVGQTGFYGAVSHWLGVLAGVLGRRDESVELLQEALGRHRAMGATPFGVSPWPPCLPG